MEEKDPKIFEAIVERTIAKINHYLITMLGKTEKKATAEEFYYAFCFSLREDITMNWAAMELTRLKKDPRMIYYISLEYLPGRFLTNNIFNMESTGLVDAVLKHFQRERKDIIGLELDAGLGNGGLGRLASCILDSLATGTWPAKAYGLRYQYGIFQQEIWDGVQVETPDLWLLKEHPWGRRTDEGALTVQFGMESLANEQTSVEDLWKLGQREEVRVLPFDYPIVGYKQDHYNPIVTLRLWSTKESPRNFKLQRYNSGQLDQAAENTSLTNVLYPNDNHEMGKRIRLKQEFLLVSASLQDIIRTYFVAHPDLSGFHDKVRIQLNDTHPVLAIAELIRILINEHQFKWETAVEQCLEIFSYTNHTILKEALEEWNQQRLFSLLPLQFRIIERLNLEFCNKIREKFHDEDKVKRMSIIEGGQVKMAHLAIAHCHKVNGVAALHTEILKHNIFKDFYDLYPNRFVNVTNGVTHRRWVLGANPFLSKFLNTHIGDEWICDFNQISKLKEMASKPEVQQEFLAIKKQAKEQLIQFIIENSTHRDEFGNVLPDDRNLSSDALFDVQIKRIHEYKRQLLNVLHIVILYQRLLDNVNASPIQRVVVIAGKAAPGYHMAKSIIRLINAIARVVNVDERIQHKLKVVFIENYNVSRAEKIIPAADLSQQISLAGMEASGTGNMKLSMNGALTIGTDDGANIEMKEEITQAWWPFGFGMNFEEVKELRKSGRYNPIDIYRENPQVKRALDSLTDETFARNDAEREAFNLIVHSLLHQKPTADFYFVLQDLASYLETQHKVEQFYLDKNKWAEFALHNIGSMGKFSIDNTVQNYVDHIWDIERCPIDETVLKEVQEEYSKLDRFRIV